MMMQRRHSDRGETADETLDRRIAEVQVERQRARSVPLRTEDGPGVRRLELVAPGPREEAQPCGRGTEPQVLGPQAVAQPTEVGQQQLMRQGGDGMLRPLVAGQFLWGTFQDAAGAVGTQLRALGRSPGDRERPQLPQGDPAALRAEPRRGAAAAVRSVFAPAVSPAPAVKAATSVSQDPARFAGLAVSPVPGVVGQMGGSQGVVDPAALGVEEIRKKVMREAEEAFAREMQRLQAPAEETQSCLKWHGCRTDLGWSAVCSNWRLGVGSGRWRSTKPSTGWKATYPTAWDPVWISSGKSGSTCAARIIVD